MSEIEIRKISQPHTMWCSLATEYDEGVLFSPLGMVHIFSQGRGRRCEDYTSFKFAYKGKIYWKTVRKSYKRQGLSILAHKFLKTSIEKGGE